jgi:uncharacterized protein (DUF934 family)
MALIKDRKLALDRWQLLEFTADCDMPALPAAGEVIVPFRHWPALRATALTRSTPIGVWMTGVDEPAAIAGDLDRLDLIAVRFDSFTDGRGYSTGTLLRQRYGFRGELRAIGDIQRDQLYYLARCGFDAFLLRESADVEVALEAFDDFGEAYQAAADRPLPLFRRRVSLDAA